MGRLSRNSNRLRNLQVPAYLVGGSLLNAETADRAEFIDCSWPDSRVGQLGSYKKRGPLGLGGPLFAVAVVRRLGVPEAALRAAVGFGVGVSAGRYRDDGC